MVNPKTEEKRWAIKKRMPNLTIKVNTKELNPMGVWRDQPKLTGQLIRRLVLQYPAAMIDSRYKKKILPVVYYSRTSAIHCKPYSCSNKFN